MNNFGREVVITGEVKYIGEGEDPSENPYMKAYAYALKEIYQPERSKREDDIMYLKCQCGQYKHIFEDQVHMSRCGALNSMET